jgi:hypothetical protein
LAKKRKVIGVTGVEPSGVEPERKRRLLRTASEQEIRSRAYEIYLERGAQPGNELGDWLQAERELKAVQPDSAD